MEVIDPSDVWSMWRVVPRQKIERKQVFFSQQQALFVFLTCILTFLCGRTDNHLIQPRLGNGHVCCHIFTLFLTQSHSLEIHFTYNLICLDWLSGALVSWLSRALVIVGMDKGTKLVLLCRFNFLHCQCPRHSHLRL